MTDLSHALDASDASDPAPLIPAGAQPDVTAQLEALQKQMAAMLAIQQGAAQFMMAQAQAQAQALAPTGPSDDQLMAAAAAVPMPAAEPQPKVLILLEENDNIPPGGQFISVNGLAYLLQPGVEVEVPVSVLDVLDNAITSVPVRDADMNVIGYKDRLRFPYRTIRNRTPVRDEPVAGD